MPTKLTSSRLRKGVKKLNKDKKAQATLIAFVRLAMLTFRLYCEHYLTKNNAHRLHKLSDWINNSTLSATTKEHLRNLNNAGNVGGHIGRFETWLKQNKGILASAFTSLDALCNTQVQDETEKALKEVLSDIEQKIISMIPSW